MLAKTERLRNGRIFQQAYAKGRRIFAEYLVLHVYVLEASLSQRQVGFAVSKKVGNAVTRNLVRRRLREAFRHIGLPVCHGTVLIISARPGAAKASFATLRDCLIRALKEGGLLEDMARPLPESLSSG